MVAFSIVAGPDMGSMNLSVKLPITTFLLLYNFHIGQKYQVFSCLGFISGFEFHQAKLMVFKTHVFKYTKDTCTIVS